MRRPFGPAMGSGGGGGMIKTVHKAISRAGINGGAISEPVAYSQSTTTRTTNNHQLPINTALSLSSNNLINHPVPAAPTTSEESDWECIDNTTTVNEVYDDSVFGTVPSKDEVHQAVSSLQEVLDVVSFSRYGIDNDKIVSCPTNYFQKSGSDQLDWTEPSLELCNSMTTGLQSSRVYDAFHLMQTEPSVQRMVISLSSDKGVWDAVMNNEVVRELRESISDEEKSIWDDVVVDNGSNPVKQVLHWMFVNTKDKVIEIVEKITKIVNELVQPPAPKEKPKPKPKPKQKREGTGSSNPCFEEKLRSSFLLSIMVLLIVVVTRGHTHKA